MTWKSASSTAPPTSGFIILPKRPEGTEGMSEEALADLVTCESVTGVAHAKGPGQARTSAHY